MPFGAFCIVVLMTVVVFAFTMGAAPGEYV